MLKKVNCLKTGVANHLRIKYLGMNKNLSLAHFRFICFQYTIISTICQFIWLLAYCLERLVAINLKCTQNYQKVSRIKLSLSVIFTKHQLFSFFFFLIFLCGFSFTDIDEVQDCMGRRKHFFNSSLSLPPASQTLRHQSGSLLHIANSQTRTGNLWFASASR